ncbi:MAG TPA: class II fumarate hydratase, partial [Verrucomicrobiales bacterium]|nr:class II fumarate hydratase [Verrucomicrobiales bacterium]
SPLNVTTRIERDTMGEMEVPAEALYGASTQRAVLNFPVSGTGFSRPMIRAMGLVKWAAAVTNAELDLLDPGQAEAIAGAAQEVIDGVLDAHFVVDVYQTGSGTSTNMNANEVIANRCSQHAGKPIGSRDPVHPNDHVNMGQSSNDVIPTAIHIAVAESLRNNLAPALIALHSSLAAKAAAFHPVIKIGRTHLMDATPVRLGQVFGGYARQLELSVSRTHKAINALLELPLGGTAVGTGINCHPQFARLAIEHIAEKTNIDFREAADHFEAQAAKDGLVEASGQLKTIAVSLFKVANDIRWLSSGPRCGIGEIQLPATQPGSSIMPGKVNPVMAESLMQVAARVVGNDAAVAWAGANGNFELNVMMPVMAHSLLESIRLMSAAVSLFQNRCVEGIQANAERCEGLIELSMSMVTSLAPLIGYDRAAAIAKESVSTGKTVRQICVEQQVLPPDRLAAALDPVSMTAPGIDPIS